VKPEMFLIPVTEETLFPVMEVKNAVINRRSDRSIPSKDGYYLPSPEDGLMKVAMVDRQSGRVTTSFLANFGARVGAMASTENASYQIMVVGCSDEDMALAVNRVLEMKGGVVIADQGKVIHELALPLGGLMSEEPVAVLAKQVEAMNDYLASLGFKLGDPYYFFSFLPSTFFPDLRVTTEGLFDVKKGTVLIPPRQVG
ncbi:MAG: adenine deaminase C-terminal domain-containing protein, partial [Dehalococcoidia bacterium]|nr:adenine deaminase C-terminal domain-containing protein [Dehalococcoidia bacterium]